MEYDIDEELLNELYELNIFLTAYYPSVVQFTLGMPFMDECGRLSQLGIAYFHDGSTSPVTAGFINNRYMQRVEYILDIKDYGIDYFYIPINHLLTMYDEVYSGAWCYLNDGVQYE